MPGCWWRLRPVAIALNLLMIASTPVMGAHYFVDLLGGIIVALAAIAAAGRLIPISPEARP